MKKVNLIGPLTLVSCKIKCDDSLLHSDLVSLISSDGASALRLSARSSRFSLLHLCCPQPAHCSHAHVPKLGDRRGGERLAVKQSSANWFIRALKTGLMFVAPNKPFQKTYIYLYICFTTPHKFSLK